MKKQHATILMEIISDLHLDDTKPDSAVELAVNEYYNAIRANNPRKPINSIEREFFQKCGILQNKLRKAFLIKKSQDLSKITKEIKEKSAKIENEKKYSIKKIAEIMGVTIQNVNQHLRNLNGKINVIEDSPRKRFLTESEFKKFKSLI